MNVFEEIYREKEEEAGIEHMQEAERMIIPELLITAGWTTSMRWEQLKNELTPRGYASRILRLLMQKKASACSRR